MVAIDPVFVRTLNQRTVLQRFTLHISKLDFKALKMLRLVTLISSKVVKTHFFPPILLIVDVTCTKEKEYQTTQEIKKYHN